jgi:hypothetical protein
MISLPLSELEIRRFGRQVLVPEIGGRGQRALCGARVRVASAGRSAEVCTRYLRAAGVGVDEGAPDLVMPAEADHAVQAWIEGAFAAVETIKRLVGAGAPALARWLELPDQDQDQDQDQNQNQSP